jgi:phage-related protein
VKAVLWVGRSRDDVRRFPQDARQRAGYELYLVQQGLDPADWKPMATVGPGVRQVRIHTGREHRVIYLAKFAEGVYVLHAFEKKTRRTAKADLEVARSRLTEVLAARRRRERSAPRRSR